MKTMPITYNLYTIIDGKYAENKLLINAMMQIKGDFETCEK